MGGRAALVEPGVCADPGVVCGVRVGVGKGCVATRASGCTVSAQENNTCCASYFFLSCFIFFIHARTPC